MLASDRKGPSPASHRILQALQERIVQGVYGPGARLPTERDLATEFSADRSAVRAALAELARGGMIVREPGRRPWVSPQEREQTPPEAAPRRRTLMRTVAAILPQHEADRASREIVRGINHVLRAQPSPYHLLIFDTDLRTVPRAGLEQEACTTIEEAGISGAIVWPTLEEGSLSAWRHVRDQGHPLVFVDRHDETLPCDFVGVDNYAAAREAVEYLLGLGHRRIVHLTNDEPVSSVLERAAGYRDALSAAGVSGEAAAPWVMPLGASPERVEEFVTYCVQSAAPPTAVFALNDRLAHTLIARLEARGVGVPDQISVMGFDDEDRYSPRPALLTTMRQPFERIGQRAAALLMQRLSATEPGARPFQHIVLPTTLIERRTCRPLEQT